MGSRPLEGVRVCVTQGGTIKRNVAQASTINWFKLDDLTEPATEAPAAEKGAEAGAKAMHQPEDKAQATRESTAEGAAADNATTAGEDTMDEAEKAKQVT